MIVKICGITNIVDALQAIDCGADMLGFNFFPGSKRYISEQECCALVNEITRHTSRVIKVGVFVNSPTSEVKHLLNSCGLDLAQLSGDESAAEVEALLPQGFKAIRPPSPDTFEQELQAYLIRENPPRLLVDHSSRAQDQATMYGGSGEKADWRIARQISEQYPILLAGGLNPENVAQAIEEVRPWGVDVASGVEKTGRQKDFEKVQAFIRTAKRVNLESI